MQNLTTSELYMKQLEYEKEMVDLGRESYLTHVNDAESSGRGADTSYARSIVAQVAGKITDAVARNLDKSKSMYTEPLRELKYDRAVVIALRTLFIQVTGASDNRPIQRTAASIAIAEAIQLELKMQSLCDESPEYMKEVQTNWKTKRASSVRHKSNVVNHIITDNDMKWEHWNKGIKTGVGGLLLLCICDNSEIFQMKTMKAGRKRYETIITFTDESEEWIQKHKDFRSLLRPLYRPMIVPPVEWSSRTKPYLSAPVNSTLHFVRVRSKEGRKFYRDVTPNMHKAISLAQSTSWRINTSVHDFIKELMKLRNPLIVPQAQMTEKPICPIPKDAKPDDLDEKQALAFKDWKSIVRTMYTEDVARRSNRNRLLMVDDIASEYRSYEKIYFPHSIDSRGRIYSIPTVLQPQGDDVCKGILEFATGEKLTKEGIYQLKLHIASKYGHDKESHVFRIKWFDENEQVLLEVAKNPLDHLSWFADADKPFQTYAGIKDYAKWKHNPNAVIHARVNKDGACNGLQHFSAMLRDGDVGRSVNLTESDPMDAPESIYKVIAKEVKQRLDERSNNGEMMANQWVNFWDIYNEGNVDYKCMKRPVMTLPYSATLYSRMQYIKDYIREKDAHTFFGKSFGKSVKYFADVVTEAMDSRISSARLILDWLVLACRDIMAVQDNVQWTTPLGFTVYNNKKKQAGKKMLIRYEGKPIHFRFREFTDKPDIHGMASAIAPNFVHSMDACHMLRLVKRAADCNITSLHLVHDDYGCHANHGGMLADIAKEEFSDMYSENDPLMDFYESYKDIISEPPPASISTLDITDVMRSTYAFD